MNTTFSFNRLGLLLKRFFIENQNREMMFWGILTIVFTLVHQTDSLRMILYFTGFLFAARLFKVFSFAPGGMHYLLIPATHTEKLAANILLSTLYFFIMTMVTYSIGNLLGTTIVNQIFGTSNPVSWDLFHAEAMHNYGQVNVSSTNGFWDLLGSFATIQAIFMLGSLYFSRNAVGRTMLSLLGLGILLTIIQLSLIKIIFGTFSLTGDMGSMNIMLSNSSIPDGIGMAFKIGGYLFIPFLWVVSYFRLTEKQV